MIDFPPLDELLNSSHVVALPMKHPLRGITCRESVLFRGPHSWAEYSPLPGVGTQQAALWLACAIECGWGQNLQSTEVFAQYNAPRSDCRQYKRTMHHSVQHNLRQHGVVQESAAQNTPDQHNPSNLDLTLAAPKQKSAPAAHSRIPVNAILPDVPASMVPDVLGGNMRFCQCVKIKVGTHFAARDLPRIRAALDFMGADTTIRLDANSQWSVAETLRNLAVMEKEGFLKNVEYLEQPCKTPRELALLKEGMLNRGYATKLAADESLSLVFAPQKNMTEIGDLLSACDVLVLKAQPLGGIGNAKRLVENVNNHRKSQGKINMEYTVASCLETSLGTEMGALLVSCLPHVTLPAGLATAALLAADITHAPLVPDKSGCIDLRKVEVVGELLNQYAAHETRVAAWHKQIRATYAALLKNFPWQHINRGSLSHV